MIDTLRVGYACHYVGYGKFMDFVDNPAEKTALKLNGTCHNIKILGIPPYTVCYDGVSVPVDHIGASSVAKMLREKMGSKWEVIVHLGLENKAKGLCLETVGANILAENDGVDTEIVPGGPDVLPTTVDLSRLVLSTVSTNITVKEVCAKHHDPYHITDMVTRCWIILL